MSANPVEVIANAIRAADGGHTMGADALAEVAAGALLDERVVDHAVQALIDAGWVADPATEDDAYAIARTVLRSVGGA